MKGFLNPLVIALCIAPLSAAADCERPWPAEVPDGETATKEEMIEAQRGIKAYMAEADAYMLCLEEEGAAVKVDPTDEAAVAEALEGQAMRDRRHNAMVEELEAVAERFNQTVRAYKAR